MWIRVEIILLLACFHAMAQIIPADRLPCTGTWEGLVGVPGGIPYRTNIYTNLTSSVSLSALNAAIANCPSNQVVKLGAGTYTFNGQVVIENNGVTLRGEGTNTILKGTGSGGYAGFVHIGTGLADPNVTPPDNIVSWTAGYTRGTSNITVSSAAGMTVGMMLTLDQLFDLPNGVNPYGSDDGGAKCDHCGRVEGSRPKAQIVTVTNISGTSIGISPALYIDFNESSTPEAWWLDEPTRMSGIEDLSITNAAGDAGYWLNVGYYNASGCWASNVSSYMAIQNHHRAYYAQNIEIRGCYSYGTVNEASQSYGITWQWVTGGLAEDNIFDHVTSPLSHGSLNTGNVQAYNYATNLSYYNENWLIEGYSFHASHANMNLGEGNWQPNLWLDFLHGSASHIVHLRNRILGYDGGEETLSTYPVSIQCTNRYHTFVGNIVGWPGYHTSYENAYGTNQEPTVCWNVGYWSTDETYPTRYDTATYTTLLRKANWDSAENGIRSTESVGSTNVPTSLLHSTKPSWFGFLTWPPFDPANGSSNNPTNIPAGYRYFFGTNPPAGGVSAPRKLRVVNAKVGTITPP